MSRYHEVNWALFRGLVRRHSTTVNVTREGVLHLCPWKSSFKVADSHEIREVNDHDLGWDEIPFNLFRSYGPDLPKPSTGVSLGLSRDLQSVKTFYPKPHLTRSEINLPILGLPPLVRTTIPSEHCGEVNLSARKRTSKSFIPDISKKDSNDMRKYYIVSENEFGDKERVTTLEKYARVFYVLPTSLDWRCTEAVEILARLESRYKEHLAEFLLPILDDLLLNEEWDLVVTDSLAVSICVLKTFPDKSLRPFYFAGSDLTLEMNGKDLGNPLLTRIQRAGDLTGPLYSAISLDNPDDPSWTDPFLESLKNVAPGKKILVLNLSNRFYTRKISNVIRSAGGYPLPVTLIRTSSKRL